MTARIPLAPQLHGSAFHVREADFHGASLKRLRGLDLQRPFTGVRSVGLDLDSVRDRCLAYLPLLRPGDAFSHETAAMLLGLPMPRSLATSDLHVASQPGVARARCKGVVGHEHGMPFPTVLIDAFPVATAAVAWCQLAVSLDRHDLVAVGDAIITGRREAGGRRAAPLATVAQLEAAARWWGRRRGARALAWALPRVRVGADSRPETLTRLCLVEAGFPEPLVGDATPIAGGRVLHPDLKWPQWRLLLEYEGDAHRSDRKRWRRDIARKGDFEAAGWIVIRVTADDLFVDRAAFLQRVRACISLAERRADTG